MNKRQASCEPSQGLRSEPESTIDNRPLSRHDRKIEHNLVAKNVGNTTSRQLAVAAMCAHCMGCTTDRIEPGFKDEIRNCTAPRCPLWHFRPYKAKGGAAS